MFQSRTHTCGELRLSDAGKKVKLWSAGWKTSARSAARWPSSILRDFYGTTQVVVETRGNDGKVYQGREHASPPSPSTGTVRERASKNPKLPTGDIEVVPAEDGGAGHAAATTSCPSRSTAAGRPTRPPG